MNYANPADQRIVGAYLRKTLSYWLGYVWTYFAMVAIVNALLIYLVSGENHGVFSVVDKALEKSSSGRGQMYVLAFVLLGPLFNIYATAVAVKSAVEADDDYHHRLQELTHLSAAPGETRRRLISVLSLSSGLLFLPPMFWLYTAQFEVLWGYDLPVFAQPGAWLSVGLVIGIYYLVPKVYPEVAQRLSDIEDSITSKVSNS